MMDSFKKHSRSLTSPPENAIEVVGEDSADLAYATRALYIGGGGDLRVRMLGGGTVTLANVPSGTLIPLRVTRIFATGTTATEILGLW
jgi:hypothetical protein